MRFTVKLKMALTFGVIILLSLLTAGLGIQKLAVLNDTLNESLTQKF